ARARPALPVMFGWESIRSTCVIQGIIDDAAPPRSRSLALELQLDPDLESSAEATLAVDLQRRREQGIGVAQVRRLGRALVGLDCINAQVVRVQQVEDLQRSRRQRLPHDECLAQVDVDVQGGVIALAVAPHALKVRALARIDGGVPEARAELLV